MVSLILQIFIPGRSVRPCGRRSLTGLASLLHLDLVQASEQGVNFGLDLRQLPLDGLQLLRLHC